MSSVTSKNIADAGVMATSNAVTAEWQSKQFKYRIRSVSILKEENYWIDVALPDSTTWRTFASPESTFENALKRVFKNIEVDDAGLPGAAAKVVYPEDELD